MSAILQLGASALLSVLLWASLLSVATLVASLLVVRACRRRLRGAGRPTRHATAVLVPLLCVLLPMFAAYMGAACALQRSCAAAIDRGSDALVDLAATRGLAAGKRELGVTDDEAVFPVETLRRASRGRTAGRPSSGAATHHPLLLPFVIAMYLPELLETAWWSTVDLALAGTHDLAAGVTWRDVERLVERHLRSQGGRLFGMIADDLRAGARFSLWIALLAALVAYLLALAITARMARAAPAPP
jgi:hypothetical protein